MSKLYFNFILNELYKIQIIANNSNKLLFTLGEKENMLSDPKSKKVIEAIASKSTKDKKKAQETKDLTQNLDNQQK